MRYVAREGRELRARGYKVLQFEQFGSNPARESRVNFALAMKRLQVTRRCRQCRKTRCSRWLLAALILQVSDSVATKARRVKALHSPAESRPKAPRVISRDHFATLHLLNVSNKMACRDRDTTLGKLRVSSIVAKHGLQSYRVWCKC